MSIPPRLKELHNRLVEITTEYQNLLDMFLSFFNSLQEVFNLISTIMFSVFKNIYFTLFFSFIMLSKILNRVGLPIFTILH